MLSNREVYSSVEFESWAKRADVEPAEAYLLRNYLDSGGRTVEAGIGGGRLLLALGDLGFTHLYGFDFVPEFVMAARVRDSEHRLKLAAQDATRLGYADASFDQIIYLQQVICLIENAQGRRHAMEEAIRILRPGGVALFSFLSHEVRSQAVHYRLFSTYLQALRLIRGARRKRQVWPWLRLGGRFNYRSLYDAGPYVYWYRLEEAVSELQSVGFKVKGVASRLQIEKGRLCESAEGLLQEPMAGGLYCVCSK
jgi:SAM-dependent methyltransferase